MKQKSQDSLSLHEFYLNELKKIVGNSADVDAKGGILNYEITPLNPEKCLWQVKLERLFEFFINNELYFYVDFSLNILRAYSIQGYKKKHR